MTKRKANQPVNATSSYDDLRDRARELWEEDGEIEIDYNAKIERTATGVYVQAWVWVPLEEDKSWGFTVSSTKEFGPYSSEKEAEEGINRVRLAVNDGIQREFSAPYQKTEEEEAGQP